MLGSACRLRLRPATVALALGEAIELQHDVDVIGQQRDFDPTAQAAQAERRHRRTMSALGGSGRAAPFHANISG